MRHSWLSWGSRSSPKPPSRGAPVHYTAWGVDAFTVTQSTESLMHCPHKYKVKCRIVSPVKPDVLTTCASWNCGVTAQCVIHLYINFMHQGKHCSTNKVATSASINQGPCEHEIVIDTSVTPKSRASLPNEKMLSHENILGRVG